MLKILFEGMLYFEVSYEVAFDFNIFFFKFYLSIWNQKIQKLFLKFFVSVWTDLKLDKTQQA